MFLLYFDQHKRQKLYQHQPQTFERSSILLYFFILIITSLLMFPMTLSSNSFTFIRHFYPKCIHFLSVCVFPGNWTHNLLRCLRNALPLSHRNILEQFNTCFCVNFRSATMSCTSNQAESTAENMIQKEMRLNLTSVIPGRSTRDIWCHPSVSNHTFLFNGNLF